MRAGWAPNSNLAWIPARSGDPELLPIPSIPDDDGGDLLIEISADSAPVFLGVHSVLDRAPLYAMCKGNGVEIGPGARPQIINSAATKVRYVEQADPAQWQALYGIDRAETVDESLWKHYVVDNADSIPAKLGSLDFVFSSHVLEHLANPLGHLAYWATLLAPGGRVVAIVPDREGCKDFVFQNSTLTELLEEFQQGAMAPSLAHYARWNRYRMPKDSPEAIMASGRSIHVHFYTADSMRRILAATHERIGFSKFEVISAANHKDFFLVLQKNGRPNRRLFASIFPKRLG